MTRQALIGVFVAAAGAALLADEGMWRFDQLPADQIAARYGVKLTSQDLERLQGSAVRILTGSSGGTGSFASPNGLVVTNHHVALDCIRTSTLAEQSKGKADNLVEEGFTAATPADELACKRFRVQVERSARDVTAAVNAGVTPGMSIADIQKVRQAARSDLERACKEEKGDNYSCNVVDFNSGARSLLITWEEWKDVRLVYAPEKQLGYFGGDEMNFRFPRYVSDISILRVYQGKDGSHGDFDPEHVPVRPRHHLQVTLDGVKEGDFTFVAGYPGTTNRYRMSFSASYNLRKGLPDQIRDVETELGLLRKYAALKPDYQLLLQERIFGLANTLKYQRDVLAALESTKVVADREERERAFTAFLEGNAAAKSEYGGVLSAQRAVYANEVEANADLDNALGWLQRPSAIGYALGLYEFALERAKAADREREPQFQERNWPDLREALLDDEPVIADLETDVLTLAMERALALPPDRQIPAVKALVARVGAGASARALATAVLDGSKVVSAETRKALIDAPVATFDASPDPAIVFARELIPSMKDLRARVRVLNEKLFQNRAAFSRGLVAWKGQTLYPDANFTLRATFGRVAGYRDARGSAVPFTTRFGDMFTLAASRGNTGEFALPAKLAAWRARLADDAFKRAFADLPVDFVSTNDTTGGNSGSATLNKNLEIVGLIFDGNAEGMAGDWTYSETAGRALSTDIRFALTIAREVHGAGWVVDELIGSPGQ